jgi:hypothetical protein
VQVFEESAEQRCRIRIPFAEAIIALRLVGEKFAPTEIEHRLTRNYEVGGRESRTLGRPLAVGGGVRDLRKLQGIDEPIEPTSIQSSVALPPQLTIRAPRLENL